jgi:hypothetical protein
MLFSIKDKKRRRKKETKLISLRDSPGAQFSPLSRAPKLNFTLSNSPSRLAPALSIIKETVRSLQFDREPVYGISLKRFGVINYFVISDASRN